MFDPKICEICAAAWTPTTRYQATRNRTCGRKCGAVLLVRNRPAKSSPTPSIRCATCGTLVHRPASHAARSVATYCSTSCRSKTFAARLRPFAGNMRGRKRRDARRGPENPAWKGGVTLKRPKGNYAGVRYVRCPAEFLAMARKDGYVSEHRLVMAQWVGRCLTRSETVHHIDHRPGHNMRANLELWPDNGSHKRAEHGRFVEGAFNRV